jgi:hypothetical protein
MNALRELVDEVSLERLQADLAARVDGLFRRCPWLCGFSLDGELFVAELACHPPLDGQRAAMVADEIAHALSELVDEEPDAAELIRGRTFARSLH